MHAHGSRVCWQQHIWFDSCGGCCFLVHITSSSYQITAPPEPLP